jgi:hypothetical protein
MKTPIDDWCICTCTKGDARGYYKYVIIKEGLTKDQAERQAQKGQSSLMTRCVKLYIAHGHC